MKDEELKFKNRSSASRNKIHSKKCKICGIETLMAKNQKYCSSVCKGKVQYVNGNASTENQYLKISGNWPKYLQKLVYFHSRTKDGLTVKDLLDILEKQNYKCALSGVQLTCLREKGKIFKTNASIDRINAGGSYTPENVQLVCRAVNSWRSNLTISEFVDWCKKVANYNE